MVRTKRTNRTCITHVLVSLLFMGFLSLSAASCTNALLVDSNTTGTQDIQPESRAQSTSGWKGVNLPAVWYYDKSLAAVPYIKSLGFNAVRVVWSTSDTVTRLKAVTDKIYNAGMVAIPELHDGTGSDSTSVLYDLTTWWINNKSILTSRPAMPFNIANEWGSSNMSDITWRDTYKTAVARIRNAGITNPIVIDAAGWGQVPSCIVNYGDWVLGADSKSNCIFSIHMYGNWNTTSNIYYYLNYIKNTKKLSVMVGEFGYNYNSGNNNLSCKVDAKTLIANCKSLGVGYFGWSWAGNDSSNAWLDMSSDWKTLNTWGKLVLNGY